MGDITWLRKPILQPSNDIVNGFVKNWMKAVLYRGWKLRMCHAITKPMAKEHVIGHIIVKQIKLLKPGWLARTHGLAKCVFTKLEVRWLMETVRNFGQFG